MNTDRYSYLLTEPYRLLGLLFLIVAGISMCTGKTLTRGQGLVSRAEEPLDDKFCIASFRWLRTRQSRFHDTYLEIGMSRPKRLAGFILGKIQNTG